MREKLHKLLPKELLQEEFNKGLWHKDIAKKYRVPWRQIYYLVEDYGLKIPRKNKKKEIIKYKCSKCGKEFKVLHNGLCNNCLNKQYYIETEKFINSTNSCIHDKIIKLRKLGKSHSEIVKEIGCAKSTVSYHCNIKTKQDCYKRSKQNRNGSKKWLYNLIDKVNNFKIIRKIGRKNNYSNDWNKKLRTAVSGFRLSTNNIMEKYYTYKDVIEKFGYKVKCELTGRIIDIKRDNYHLDHIIPVSRGGTNDLSNMAFTIPEANFAKGNMLNEEFVALCKEVCENFGYEVNKKE